jgi:hypothetical protein
MARTVTLKKASQIDDEISLGYPLLGYNVVISLGSFEIKAPELKILLQPLGLEKHLPGVAEPSTRLRRAARVWLKQVINEENLFHLLFGATGAEAESKNKKLWRSITNPKDSLVGLALVVEDVDLNEYGLSYLSRLRLFYEKDTTSLYVTTTGVGRSLQMGQSEQELLASLLPFWKFYEDVYTSAELRKLFKSAILAMDTTQMRHEGGSYFVPYERRADLQRLKDLIEGALPVGTGEEENTSALHAFPLVKTNSTKTQLAEIAFQALNAEIENLATDLQRFITVAQTPKTKKNGELRTTTDGQVKYGRVKMETVERLRKEFKGKVAKIQLYNAKLDMQQQQLLKRLEELQAINESFVDTAAEALSRNEEEIEGEIELEVGGAL